MPVLRHRIHQGGSADDFVMAWISVPDLGLHRSLQRYTFVEPLPEGALVRFEAIDDDFVAEVSSTQEGSSSTTQGSPTGFRQWLQR